MVLGYDAETEDFDIQLLNPPLKKTVKRLSLRFKDEDPRRFERRLQECRILREEALALRRYDAFVQSQVSSLPRGHMRADC